MRFDIRSYLPSLLALVGFLVLGCDNSVSPVAPTTAAVHVTVVTTGASQNLDADGYALRLDSNPYQHVGVNDTASVSGIATGTHMLELDGVATNCAVDGSNPRRVDVVSGTLSYAVTFSVKCLGTTGSVRISTVTTGESQDTDGYSADIPEVGGFHLPSNGTRTITGLKLGTIGISLSDVAGNCAVDNPRTHIAQVVNDSTVNVAFVISCIAAGSLKVTTVTEGVDADQNGYGFNLQLEGANDSYPFTLSANSTFTIPSLLPGNYLLYPVDVAPNCNPVVPTPRKIFVGIGDPTPIVVEINCLATTPLAFVLTTNGSSTIQKMNSNGTGLTQLTPSPGTDQNPAWSPDGTRIAFASSRAGNYDIFVMNANGENVVRLTTDVPAEYAPAWSPDGAQIAFTSQLSGSAEISVMNSDGTHQVRLTSNDIDSDPAWSPDGGKIAFSRYRGGVSSIWVMNADGTGAHQVTSGETSDSEPAWSPDGSRIAFSSSRTDQSIVVINADGSGRTQITPGMLTAMNAAWSPDGNKIAFTSFQSCGYYDYYSDCGRYIRIIGLDGTQYSSFGDGLNEYSEPAWRR
jgi:Periplasmic component of the Tol biopolymer transport system